jgi:serine/threonine protein phosphatase PrpC
VGPVGQRLYDAFTGLAVAVDTRRVKTSPEVNPGVWAHMTYAAVSALSHVGLVREHNEDSLVVGPWTLCATVTESPQTLVFPTDGPLVVAVADGLGGHPGGEVASGLVVRQLAAAHASLSGEAELRAAIEACNRAVYVSSEANPDLVTMGTTLAGVLVVAETVWTFSVGDSRVYVLTAEGLQQVSVDDSPPLAPGERSTVIVTQTMGGHYQHTPVEPHIVQREVSLDERYLICSDGVSDMVSDDVIELVLREHEDGRAAFELWKKAIEAGGYDNITLAVLRFGSQS